MTQHLPAKDGRLPCLTLSSPHLWTHSSPYNWTTGGRQELPIIGAEPHVCHRQLLQKGVERQAFFCIKHATIATMSSHTQLCYCFKQLFGHWKQWPSHPTFSVLTRQIEWLAQSERIPSLSSQKSELYNADLILTPFQLESLINKYSKG